MTVDVGLGLFFNPIFGGDHAGDGSFGHGGSRCAYAFVDPTCDLAAVVLFNGRPCSEVHYERARRISTALYEDLGLVGDGAN
mmetsp:Transcript_24950/g.30122  ORF Transcript_24950/g.30122 Transcript_24950/m.30122 type:complete len:82 (+) Transcript_24950:1-246(+)